MAQVPYQHVLAPGRVYVDGALAFSTGDPMPLDTADRLGLLDPPYSLAVLPAYSASEDDDVVFEHGELQSIVEEAVAAVLAGLPGGGTVADATTTTKGKVQLAGDLAGTAASPTVPGLATKAADSVVVKLTGDQTIAGTKTHTGAVRNRHIETHFDVLAFGGVSSIAEATATFQAASAEWSTNGGGKLHFPGGGDFTLNGNVPLPQSSASSIKHWSIDGHWCKLRGASGYAGVVLGDPLPANTAAVHLGRMMDIRRLDMIGDGSTAGQIGLRVIGGQNHLISHNKFRSFDINCDIIFCLGASIEYNEAASGRTYDFLVRCGMNADGSLLWADASPSNSASNSATLYKNRSYAAATVDAQFAVLGSDGVEVWGCIAEGVAGDNAVLFDALGSGSVRQFRVHNLHSENFPSNAIIKAKPSSGRVYVTGVKNDLGAVLVDGRGANATSVFELDMMVLGGSGVLFAADAGGGVWYFRNPSAYGREDVAQSSRWLGGVKPYVVVDRLSNPTQEPGLPDGSHVIQGHGGGKFIAAAGGAIITVNSAPGSAFGNTGDTAVKSTGGIFQKLSGTWAAPPEVVVAHGNTGSTETIDVAGGTVHTATLDANCTFIFTAPPAGALLAWSFTLKLTQDATGGRTATWPATAKWPGGTAPTLSTGAGKTDILVFVTTDVGSTWHGDLAQLDSR